MAKLEIQFVDSDEALKNRVAEEWGERAARHIHLEDGFSILAMQGNNLVGLISVYWKTLPLPLPETCEGHIDILEVHKDFRRRGIATRLITWRWNVQKTKVLIKFVPGVPWIRQWRSRCGKRSGLVFTLQPHIHKDRKLKDIL